MTIRNKIITGLFCAAAAALLSGCGAPQLDKRLTETAEAEGVLIRNHVPTVFAGKKERLLDTADYNAGVDALRDIYADELPWHDTGFEGQAYMLSLLNGRLEPGMASEWIQTAYGSPALGVQPGDLVDFISLHSGLYLFGNNVIEKENGTQYMLNALRVVCKFYDDECIAKEGRNYECEDGAMVVDGKRREDKPCGGWGANSEEHAFIMGPFYEMYPSVDGYLRQHNAPWNEQCLKDMSCGDSQGLAVKNGSFFDDFVVRFPNYDAAQKAAFSYWNDNPLTRGSGFYKLGDTPVKRWTVYLSKNLFSREPVPYTQEEFLALPAEQQTALASMEAVFPAPKTSY